MKIAAVVCNIVLFGFTCLVLLADGLPKGASYIVITLWLLLTLILTSVVISRSGASDGETKNKQRKCHNNLRRSII
jgi:hypothetical protein